jgi:hypothetical protein
MIDLPSTFAQREWGARPSRSLRLASRRTLSLSSFLRASLCHILLVPWQQESVFISLLRRSFVKADAHLWLNFFFGPKILKAFQGCPNSSKPFQSPGEGGYERCPYALRRACSKTRFLRNEPNFQHKLLPIKKICVLTTRQSRLIKPIGGSPRPILTPPI